MERGDFMKNKGTGIIVAVTIVVLLALMGSCSSHNDDYSKTLNDGLEKYYSGKEMTEKEYKAVESYNKWQSKQGTKTYDDWSK